MRERRRASRTAGRAVIAAGDFARFDDGRAARTGVPEVVLAEGKRPAHLVAILTELQSRGRGAIVSRLAPNHRTALIAATRAGLRLRIEGSTNVAVLEGPIVPPPNGGATVAVLTAGTADVPFAEEAIAVLRALGIRTASAHDVGVAGLHRLEVALDRLHRSAPVLYLVFAGREGALPTVVAGLVDAPVVGIPTPNGYGRGGRGEAALNAMLQSCAPLAVVNIGGGVPAALFAAQLVARLEGWLPPTSTPRGSLFVSNGASRRRDRPRRAQRGRRARGEGRARP
ncbi:MAG TPA: nickel pincer cofactor biosynthesis protein LarB [Thermoplasmata archaeon]|nr:nickel pincer cofactor biosynthesis protein LarB [Thermoplasmata archaeon]